MLKYKGIKLILADGVDYFNQNEVEIDPLITLSIDNGHCIYEYKPEDIISIEIVNTYEDDDPAV